MRSAARPNKHLGTETELVEQRANVATVVPDLKRLADQVPDAASGPGVVLVLVSLREQTLSQEGPQLSLLVSREGGPGAAVA